MTHSESVKYAPLNVGTLMDAIAEGKLDPAFPIDARHLWRAGVVTGSVKSLTKDRWGIKLLSTGAEKLNCPITIEVSVHEGDTSDNWHMLGMILL